LSIAWRSLRYAAAYSANRDHNRLQAALGGLAIRPLAVVLGENPAITLLPVVAAAERLAAVVLEIAPIVARFCSMFMLSR
jgi:hypothetical protein